MNNRMFDINGEGREFLQKVLTAAFMQAWENPASTVKGFQVDIKKGLILLEYTRDSDNKFPAPLTAEEVTPLVWKWLQSEEAQSIILESWERNHEDDDVSADPGWRVYCENWGHVGGRHEALVAIKPCWLWSGR